MSAVDQLQTILDTERQPVNPLRPHQVTAYREEADRLKDIVHAPQWVEGDRGQATKRYRALNQMLDQQAPKPTSDPNTVKKLADEIREKYVGGAMLPREVMRRNPTGAVGQFIRQEQSPEAKRALMQWKRAMWALDPNSTDPDHTNIERYRPEIGPQSGASTFMAGAQIPGVFAQSPQAKENWPLGEPTATTALAQVKTREKKERKPMTEAQKDKLRESLAKARAAQALKRAGGVG